MTLKQFIERHTSEIEPIENANRQAWWDLATTGDTKYAEKFQETQITIRKMYSSHFEYEYIKKHQHSDESLDQRQAKLLLFAYSENQIPLDLIEKIVQLETEIEETYTNFRPIINGQAMSNNELKQILLESTDHNLRQEAWEASKRIGDEVIDKVRLLVSLRNESAKKVGFPDFYAMRLTLQELDQDRLFEMLSDLDKATTPLWEQYKPHLDQNLAKRFGIAVEDLKPWHYEDPFFQEAPRQDIDLDAFYQGKPLVDFGKTFFAKVGLPVDDILARSDLYEREKKNQHAFCICIDHAQDVRILCNMRENEYWMKTLLHELGHAVYDKYIDQTLPYLLRTPAHTSTTEAIAMLFGRLGGRADFLNVYCGIDKEIANQSEKQTQKQLSASLLVFARWVLVMTHFERALYQQPDIDLNAFWWECVEKYQWIKPVANRNKPDWAAKLHLACAPVYYQNYIIGEMTASQLLHKLEELVHKHKEDFVTSKRVGEWLKEQVFASGAHYDWEETLRKATGEALNPSYFANDIRI